MRARVSCPKAGLLPVPLFPFQEAIAGDGMKKNKKTTQTDEDPESHLKMAVYSIPIDRGRLIQTIQKYVRGFIEVGHFRCKC